VLIYVNSLNCKRGRVKVGRNILVPDPIRGGDHPIHHSIEETTVLGNFLLVRVVVFVGLSVGVVATGVGKVKK